ncbi:membrane-bound ClpP family serine protease [Bradyrhizobium sp. USDA 4503]
MHTTFKAALVVATVLVALVVSIRPGPAADNSHLALTISIDGAIGPAAASYVKDGLAKAAERHAEIVILRLNTPGGLSTSMREIIADVLASPVPVVGYVAPSGAHAASAGTYILYATHLAAMAPGTNIGAATPVQIGGPIPGLPGSTPDKGGKDQKDGGHPSETKDAMTAKVTNDAVAFIRSLAELRGRNADWAEKAVRDAATLSANAALQANVIDLTARDPADLLRQVDGRTIELPGGKTQRLATTDTAIEAIDPTWIARALAVITDPNIAFILLMVGIYGLIFEFMSPGAVAPGVVGTICLLLGLYALNMLPINYAGLRPDAGWDRAARNRSLQPDRRDRPRRNSRLRAWSSHAVSDRGARLPAVMAGHRHRRRDVHGAHSRRARRAPPGAQGPGADRCASHARAIGRSARLVRDHGSRLHQRRTLASAQHRDIRGGRHGRGRQHHRFDAGGTAHAGLSRRGR